jgi:hypothetical protein
MNAQKGNGLVASNNQPAETNANESNDSNYLTGEYKCKALASLQHVPSIQLEKRLTEQLSFLPPPPFFPLLPPRGSEAEQALHDLMEHDLTQLDWLKEGKGWRLAAVMKQLDYLGWEPNSILVMCDGRGKPIASYSLPIKAKQAFYEMRNKEAARD